MKTYESHSSEDTARIASAFAETLKLGDVIAFSGELGAGKTAFSGGVVHALGYKGAVTSPTFAIANEYQTAKGRVVHADLYRIADADALYEIGFDEYLDGEHIVLIEWSERAESLLRPPYYRVRMTYGAEENARKITIEEVHA